MPVARAAAPDCEPREPRQRSALGHCFPARSPPILLAMTNAPLAVTRPVPLADLERRLQWRMAPMVGFIAIVIGLAAVAVISELVPPAQVSGLPSDPDLAIAQSLAAGRVLAPSGPLRWRCELLGEGGVSGAFTPLELGRAALAARYVSRSRARHRWDVRVVAAAAELEVVAGAWRSAEHEFRAVLDRAPGFGEARLGLGVALALRADRAPAPFSPRALRLAAPA